MTVLDLHAHYPMHLGLPSIQSDDPIHKATLTALYDLANEIDNYEAVNQPRVTGAYVNNGGPSGFVSALYDPEDEFLIEQEPHPEAIKHLLRQMMDVERDAAANNIAVVKTKQALAAALAANQPFMVHGVEGGHGLSGDPANIALLASHGVCYLTLAHLRYMGLVSTAQGFPCKTAFWKKILDEDDRPSLGLTPLGYQCLDALFASNVVLDITHCSELATHEIKSYYQTHGNHKPVISSHNGARHFKNAELNLSDEMIDFIGSTGGVVGVITFTYWLAGDSNSAHGGFDQFCDVVDYVRCRIGDAGVAIGTDLDGFIQPIPDCRNYSKFQTFAQQLEQRYGAEPNDFLNKLLSGNARRIMETALP